jgi:large subunit ribosomal protein L6
MSRIGRLPVQIPQGVKVQIQGTTINVEGPKGKLSQDFIPEVEFAIEAGKAIVTRKSDTKQAKSYHGLYRNLLNNMVVGVSAGYTKSLLITGVGFRAEVKGKFIVMNLGYSTEIIVAIPEGLQAAVEKDTKVIVTGIDKQKVGQFASEIRKLRLPEPYKGKGIKYEDEYIRRKVGKSGVK